MIALVFEKLGRDCGGRRLRGTFDFAAIDDRVRMPWRFLARHMAVDGLAAR
jgi:hypothetical protein